METKMKPIPTAEEFINRGLDDSGFELTGAQLKIISRNVIDFTKLHVKAALEAASKEASLEYTDSMIGGCPECHVSDINKDSILNAYPETNIK